MTAVHESLFRIRHYECDAYSHVNNANYLRYMQEAAMRASAAVGWDVARYTAIGQHWLVHDTTIEYLAPLRYGDTVRVKTWVLDFQRVRSRRAYELYEAGSGQLCARATTEWVYLDTQTGRPARIPAAMIAHFLPVGASPAVPRTPFPVQPPPPPGVFSMQRKVMWQEVDSANHVNNAVYLAYLSDCGFEVAEAYGWSGARMQAAGFGILVRRYRVEYVQPAVLGDHLEVATTSTTCAAPPPRASSPSAAPVTAPCSSAPTPSTSGSISKPARRAASRRSLLARSARIL
jgi:acyl-CoA thioester hydrolase